MKKLLSLVITTVLATVAFMAHAFSYTYKGVEFKGKISNGVACIKSFNNKAQDVTIPAKIIEKGVEYPVKMVSVFMNGVNYTAESLVIEEGVEEIDKYCFVEFRKLKNVTLPSTLWHVGKNAFRDNDQLSLTMLSSFDEVAIRKGMDVMLDRSGAINNFAAVNSPNPAVKPAVATTPKIQAEEPVKTQPVLIANAAVKKEEKKAVQKRVVPETPVVTASLLPAVDVDIDIPVVDTDRNRNTYCVIIANEKYADVPEVEFAERDGNVFREYCIKTLGIPEKQVKTYINASYTDVKRALTWIETMADISDGTAKILFYYAGHGIPNEKDMTAYLIPTDGFPKDVSTCFKLSDLYARLGKMKSQGVTVLLDACFSGVKRGSAQALIAARGVAVKPREDVLPSNMVVFTAASDDEAALSYQEKRHGMFTYFLLDNLKRTQGQASFGDIFKAVSTEVKKNSMLENEKLQTPSINVSSNLKQTWHQMMF